MRNNIIPVDSAAPADPSPHGPATMPAEIARIVSLKINWAYIAWWSSINRTFCIYCHTLLTRDTWTKDHIISRKQLNLVDPYFRGHINQINCVPSCPDCNTEKGDLSLYDWKGLKNKPGAPFLLKKK